MQGTSSPSQQDICVLWSRGLSHQRSAVTRLWIGRNMFAGFSSKPSRLFFAMLHVSCFVAMIGKVLRTSLTKINQALVGSRSWSAPQYGSGSLIKQCMSLGLDLDITVSYQLIPYLADKPRLISRAIGASTFLTRLASLCLSTSLHFRLTSNIKYQWFPVTDRWAALS